MALDATSIIDIIKDYANDLRRVFSVDKAVLFGSYAKWTTDTQNVKNPPRFYYFRFFCFTLHAFLKILQCD